jgi:hypothetical protein
MISIGAVDTHIDPYTHTNEYSSEPPVAVCYSCCFTIILQIPEVRHVGIPVDQQLVHSDSYPVIDIVLFSRYRVPAPP